jgi:hypothetical protein
MPNPTHHAAMHPRFRFHLLLLLPFLTGLLHAAAPYQVGDAFEPFTTLDQHEKTTEFKAGGDYLHLVVSFAMGPGKDANRYFEKKGAAYLTENHAAFLADIHGMPGVGRMFALPKMRKYPHRILLGDDDHLLDRYPQQDGKLTVFDFDPSGKITAIRFVDPDKGLDQLFPR